MTFENGARIEDAPLADSEEERRIGLSETEDIARGMLFLWERPAEQPAWMVGMSEHADMAWIGRDKQVVEIDRMTAGSRTIHRSSVPVDMAIELPRGEFARRGIRAGSRIVSMTCRQGKTRGGRSCPLRKRSRTGFAGLQEQGIEDLYAG